MNPLTIYQHCGESYGGDPAGYPLDTSLYSPLILRGFVTVSGSLIMCRRPANWSKLAAPAANRSKLATLGVHWICPGPRVVATSRVWRSRPAIVFCGSDLNLTGYLCARATGALASLAGVCGYPAIIKGIIASTILDQSERHLARA